MGSRGRIDRTGAVQRPGAGLGEAVKIETKWQFYDAYYRLALGNTIRQWGHQEFERLARAGAVPVDGVAVRCYLKDNPWMRYDLGIDEALAYVRGLCEKHSLAPAMFQYSELAPDHKTTLQGEIRRTAEFGWWMKYNDRPGLRMRDAMTEDFGVKRAEGLRALSLTRERMDGRSRDCFDELFDLYPDAVLEFACYEIGVGVLGWNTITWEVRDY